MAPRIAPPSRNAAAQALLELYQSTERRIIQEIARKRTQGYVDYAELAALRRVRKTIQQMVDKSAKYVPLAIEHEFYNGKEARKGYENALGMTEGSAERDRVAEQLVDNLMGEVQEMAQTAYQSAEAQVLGRTAPDVYRQSILRGAIVSETMGRGSLSTVEEVMRNLQAAGITAFVDKAGREWSLSAYGAMAVRTTVRQAQVSAVLTADDHDLWKIKEIGSTCPLCAVYEGRVYSKSGLNPNYPPLAAAFGKMDPAGPNDLSNTFLNIHPNCLVPGGFVLAEGLMSESRRPYNGKVVTLETSSGNRITVTPNHPVLTDHGFIAAGLLEEGQKIIEASGKYAGFFGEAPNDINIPTGLEEIFHSLVSSGCGAPRSVIGSAEQFHGDGVPDSKVDIVFADGSGISKRDPVLSQKPAEKDLPAGHLRRPVLLRKGSLAEIFIRALNPLYRRVSRFGLICGIKGISENGKDLPDLRHGTTAGFSNLSERQPGFMKFKETVKKLRVLGPELFRNIAKALAPGPLGKDHSEIVLSVLDSPRVEIKFPGDVCAREPLLVARLQELLCDDGLVVSVLTHKSTSSYSGFVYNLETKYGYYVYNSIVTHNCLHSLVKWTEDYKTDEEIRQAREFSSFETNPKTNDPRTEKQIEAYRNKERQRAAYRRDVKQFERYTRAGVEGFPKSMATFLKHKQADDDKYRAWMAEYRKVEKPKKPEKPKAPDPVSYAARDVEKRLAENGVADKVFLSSDTPAETARAIETTLTGLRQQGYPTIRGVIYNPKACAQRGAAAFYDHGTNSIYIGKRFLSSPSELAEVFRKAEEQHAEEAAKKQWKHYGDEAVANARKLLGGKLKGYEKSKALDNLKFGLMLQGEAKQATVCRSIEDVLSHEYGHAMHLMSGVRVPNTNRNGTDWATNTTDKSIIPYEGAAQLGAYALQSPLEAVAEAFAVRNRGGQIPQFYADLLREIDEKVKK